MAVGGDFGCGICHFPIVLHTQTLRERAIFWRRLRQTDDSRTVHQLGISQRPELGKTAGRIDRHTLVARLSCSTKAGRRRDLPNFSIHNTMSDPDRIPAPSYARHDPGRAPPPDRSHGGGRRHHPARGSDRDDPDYDRHGSTGGGRIPRPAPAPRFAAVPVRRA